MKAIDIKGMVFGLLVAVDVTSVIEPSGRRRKLWICKCQCGGVVTARAYALMRGQYASCGCRATNFKHGMANSPEYVAWASMKQRCLNEKKKHYCEYGGRGITIHPDWIESFEAFFNYIGPRPSEQHTLDRIDNNGNYEPGNVRWVTMNEQNRNRRDTLAITFRGAVMCGAEFARICGVCRTAVYRKLNRGWDAERIFNHYKSRPMGAMSAIPSGTG